MQSNKNMVKRSQTHSFALPNLKKQSSRYQKIHSSRNSTQKNSFLQKLNQLTPNIQYDYVQSNLINQQQKKLKNLLRQFNHQTFQIMKSYMHRANKNKKQKYRGSSTSVIEIRKKQIQNNNYVINLCQKQMEILTRKCQNLKYLSVDQFQKKIIDVKKQIQTIKNQNKEINKGNTLRGLAMVKETVKIGQLRKLETDKHLLESKKNKLETQSKTILDQTKSIQQKQLKLIKQFQQTDFLYQAALRDQDERMSANKKKQDIKQKQKVKLTNKQKNNTFDSKYQHKYLLTLKQLEEVIKNDKKVSDDITNTDHLLNQSKRQLELLQEKLNNKNIGSNQSIALLQKK